VRLSISCPAAVDEAVRWVVAGVARARSRDPFDRSQPPRRQQQRRYDQYGPLPRAMVCPMPQRAAAHVGVPRSEEARFNRETFGLGPNSSASAGNKSPRPSADFPVNRPPQLGRAGLSSGHAIRSRGWQASRRAAARRIQISERVIQTRLVKVTFISSHTQDPDAHVQIHRQGPSLILWASLLSRPSSVSSPGRDGRANADGVAGVLNRASLGRGDSRCGARRGTIQRSNSRCGESAAAKIVDYQHAVFASPAEARCIRVWRRLNLNVQHVHGLRSLPL